jgi:O-antigen/teichoic acid export membrane protein
MQNKSFGKSITLVAASRGVALLSGVFVGFLLPKVLNITDYGFYKVFSLYAVYMALLHFGFADGILLKLAGREYAALDRAETRSYTRFFLLMEGAISLLVAGVGFLLFEGDYLFIVLMLACNMLFVNVTTYYQFLSQALSRFGEYSAKSLVASVAKLLFVAVLFGVGTLGSAQISYKIYLVGLNVIDLLMLLWYVFIYREITFGEAKPLRGMRAEIVSVFKTGILLTLAYQASHLVLVLDRQFVSILFPMDTFAQYSFAYNVVSMISTMISSLAVVLLPMLKNKKREELLDSYQKGTAVVSAVAAASLLCYFPLTAFIEWFLPNYITAIPYIAIVLPAFLFTAVITIVMFTVAKVLDGGRRFFFESCAVLLCGAAANTAAYWIVGTPEAISYASILTMALWFIIAGTRLKSKTGVGTMREFFYLLGAAAAFLATALLVGHLFLGFFVYAAAIAVWTFLFYRKSLLTIFTRVKNFHRCI